MSAPNEQTDGYPGMPRWVKVTGITVFALILLFGTVQFTGLMRGMHGAGPPDAAQHGTTHRP